MSLRGLIFDVDGVLTDTVPLHYRAWERMFSELGYAFDETVYREKVDGKSRLDGVRSVMTDATEEEVTRAGALKQSYYLELLDETPPVPFADAVRLIDRATRAKLRLAAASGSRNAPLVLQRIGLAGRIQALVTGGDVTRGKPEPDIFLAAADRLELSAGSCVVFEDAEAGVEAAKRGGFVCVGVDRTGDPSLLGVADVVVTSLDQVGLTDLERRMKNR